MAQGASLISLVVGASLLAVATRTAIPPAIWLALTFLLHGTRSLPALPGLSCAWLAIYAALAVGNRGILPVSGAAYFGIVAFYAATLALPFAIDRWAAPAAGILSTLIFPIALAAVEFLRARFAPPATWGSIAYTQFGYLPLMQASAFVGIWGITFVVAWFASTLEWSWARGFELNVVRIPLATCLGVIGAIVVARQRAARACADRPPDDARGDVESSGRSVRSRRDDTDSRGPPVDRRTHAAGRQALATARLVSGREPSRGASGRPPHRFSRAEPADLQGRRAGVPRPGQAARG